MSVCVECGRAMHACEASQHLECAACRKRMTRCRQAPIRTINDPMSEEIGRTALASWPLEGTPYEMTADAIWRDEA